MFVQFGIKYGNQETTIFTFYLFQSIFVFDSSICNNKRLFYLRPHHTSILKLPSTIYFISA